MTHSSNQSKGWWNRHWRWAVPITIVLSWGALFAVVYALARASITSSWPYASGLEVAREDPAVVEALGTPIEAGFWVSGSIKVSGSSGQAELAIPIHGSKAEATLHVMAEMSAGTWQFEHAEVEVGGRDDRINLLSGRGERTW